MGSEIKTLDRNKKFLSYMVGAGVAAGSVTAGAAITGTTYNPPLIAIDTDPVNSLGDRDDMMLDPFGAHQSIQIDIPSGVGTVEGPPPFGSKMGPPPTNALFLLPGDTKERPTMPPKGSASSAVKSITKPGGLALGTPGVEVTKLTSLPSGATIDENAPWDQGAIIFQGLKKGGFASQSGDRFLGVRVDIGGGDYLYGWLRYRLGSIEAHELRFENVPNMGITVPSAAAVPAVHVAPLAALALGATGLAALRRRRKQQQAA